MSNEANPDAQVVMEENDGESYEPSEQELLEYAQWLGIELEKEKELMWLAYEGLRAPLPENWKPCKTPAGEVYFFNFATGESQWDHPLDNHYKNLYKQEKEKLQQKRKAEAASKRANLGSRAQAAAGKLPAAGKLSGEIVVPDRQAAGKPPLASTSATSLASLVDPRERRKANRLSRSGLSSGANSLHSSFDSTDVAGGNNGGGGTSRELGPLKGVPGSAAHQTVTAKASPLGVGQLMGGPLNKVPPLGSQSASPSASASDWPALSAPPVQLGTLKLQAKEQRRVSTEGEGRRRPSMQGDAEQEEHAEHLKKLRAEAAAEEAALRQQLEKRSNEGLEEFKRQLEAREEHEVQQLTQQHQQQMAELRRRHAELEKQLQEKISVHEQRIADSAALDEEAGSSREAAREARLKQVQEEAAAWAEGQKVALRQKALETAAQQVDEELLLFKEARKQEQMGRLSKEAVMEAEELQKQVADARKHLAELGEQVSAKTAAAKAAQADLATCKEQLPELEVSVRTKRNEKADLDADLTAKKTALKEVLEDLRTKEREADRLEEKIETQEQKFKPLSSELERLDTSLYATRKSLAAEEVELQKLKAQHAVMEQQLSGLKIAKEEKQAALDSLEVSLASQQQELAKVSAELGKARSEQLTQDVSLTTELRHRAGSELNDMEEELSKCRKALQEASTQLASRKSELQLLGDVSSELQDKQKRCSAVSVQLSSRQAELSEVDSDLAAKRSQLETIATLLLSKRKELSFEEQRTNITEDEKMLLEVQRQQMEKSVEEKVQAERAQLLATKMDALQAEAKAQAEADKNGNAAAAGKRPKLDTDLAGAGNPDLSSSVLVDSPVLPDEGQHAAGGRWWAPPGGRSDTGGEGAHSHDAQLDHHFSQQQQREQSRAASVLPKALAFMKQQKHFLRERSAMVQNAIAEWRMAMAAVESEPDPVIRHQQASLLRGVKATLEEQAQGVNSDTLQLNALKAQVRALEAQQGPMPAAAGNGGGLPRASKHSRKAWADSGGEDTDGVLENGSLNGQAMNGLSSWEGAPRRQRNPGLGRSSLRASIDKIGMALEDAVAAAVAQGVAAASSKGGSRTRRSTSAGQRRPPPFPSHTSLASSTPHWAAPLPHTYGPRSRSARSTANGMEASGMSLLDSFDIDAPHSQPGMYSMSGSMHGGGGVPPAPLPGLRASMPAQLPRRVSADMMAPSVSGSWLGGGGGGGGSTWGEGVHAGLGFAPPPAVLPAAASQLQFLGQWRDKSDMSEALLHQHAAWLRGFREQVEKGAAAMAVRGRAAALQEELGGAGQGNAPLSLDLGKGRVLHLSLR